MNVEEKVVIEVKASGEELILRKKSGAVQRYEMVRSVSVPWEVQFDLRTELSANIRTLLSDLYGIEAARIVFIDETGAELQPPSGGTKGDRDGAANHQS
ncbi:MAG TPA: hypothetical protein VEU30_04545 [Thermoanaerobaculia bacterium]|nr:hypothetical protein [Thermoanaerobaculia bacterium]